MAELYGWPPSVINHLSIGELLFWRTKNFTATADRPAGRMPPWLMGLF